MNHSVGHHHHNRYISEHSGSAGVWKVDYVFLAEAPLFFRTRLGQAIGSAQLMEALREGPWKSLSSGKKVALAAGLSVGATVGYIIYRHLRSCSEQNITEQSKLSLSLDVYRSIARHQSTFLDLVNQKSGAQINVLPDGKDQSSVCFLLQGTTEQILLAKCALEKLANDCEVITEVIEVPQTAFGRIIGRGGETLKLINRTSGARVNCPRDRSRSLEEKGTVTILGTRQEVQRAKEMIIEKVFENETVRKRICQSSALRQKRRHAELELVYKFQDPETELMQNINKEDQLSPLSCKTNGFASIGDQTGENSLKSYEDEILSPMSPLEISKFEIPSPDLSFQPGEHLEVYVSAYENPQHFWIQIIGVRSLQLDKLTAEMSRYYNGDTLQEHRVESIVVGDIVAAPYRDYGTWNRARVLGILGSGLVDLYYVDFGDNGELPRDQLRSMRSDFLSLPFQAIECSLAGVCPAGEVWTEEALDDFDRMTFCAEWKPLLAKLCSYSHSEMSSWPSVKLYENRQGKIVDLGEELINLGHAVSCQDDGSGLRDGDEPRSLQKILDDMTGATSELSMSCISLSGSTYPWEKRQMTCSLRSCLSSVELERADVDQNASDMLVPSLSLMPSTPSLSLNELVSHVINSSSSVLSLPSCSSVLSGTPAKSIPDFSSPMPCSSTSVNAVVSALSSVSLNDEVFFGTCDSSNLTTSSPQPVRLDFSPSTCTESSCSSITSNSSDGIRGVWYYLTSSHESSGTSLNTTMPASSNTSSYASSSTSYLSDSRETASITSDSVICLSSDTSESVDDVEMTERDASEITGHRQKYQMQLCGGSVESSDCSSPGSDLICIGSEKSLSDTSEKLAGNSHAKEENDMICAGSLSEEKVCEQAVVKEMMVGAENKMGKNEDTLKEVASISGSVDDVLEDEFN
ncbi:tudor and KH domain-containing protein isoform X2 [Hoplias malabaricus]|uniref:tudor and KH domain-containing protein isoform X2 n=1 Tax=Hoplias malabaricus TaxID=27720 RepID=UPI0034634DA0